MVTIRPFLWFDDQLEEAVDFYTSVFGDSAVIELSRMPEGTPGPDGKVLSATFRLANQEFLALNGGPAMTFSPAVSFFVSCENQGEVDYFWDQLSDGGQVQQCGWLTDRFGLTWQIVPTRLGELLSDSDPERSGRALQAMMQMIKIDTAALEAAADG